MATPSSISKCCACKGIRTCLMCERDKDVTVTSQTDSQQLEKGEEYYICYKCGCICKKEDIIIIKEKESLVVCSTHCDPTHILTISDYVINGIVFGGVVIIKDFLTEKEEAELVSVIDSAHWMESQSGRRKQVGVSINK